ncbi:aryl-sulfate sulfotransferase [Pseudomonas putida]|uniref:aryl-sulfate sulfotransferase n=1 Tax=Pseudomonas putida TaxID=303 RepID=UPI0035B4016F
MNNGGPGGTGRNWAHANAIDYGADDDSIIVSAQHQGGGELAVTSSKTNFGFAPRPAAASSTLQRPFCGRFQMGCSTIRSFFRTAYCPTPQQPLSIRLRFQTLDALPWALFNNQQFGKPTCSSKTLSCSASKPISMVSGWMRTTARPSR